MSVSERLRVDHQGFADLAAYLLNDVVLHISGHPHRMVEIEFYLYSTEHPDPFTHCDPQQLTVDSWYFHRQNGKGYKGGSFKGLDITFGAEDVHGGIIIRSIQSLADKSLVEGPCLVVNRILELTAQDSIANLVAQLLEEQGDKDQTLPSCHLESSLYISPVSKSFAQQTLLKGPRVGLTLKRASGENWERYLMANYRFVAATVGVKKYRNHLIVELLHDGLAEQRVSQLTGAKTHMVRKCQRMIDEFVEPGSWTEYYGRALKGLDLITLQLSSYTRF